MSNAPGAPAIVREPRTTATAASPTKASISIPRYGVGPEQQKKAEEMVEPAAVARDHEHALGTQGKRLIEGELEVGRILRGRVTHDPRSAFLGRW